MRGLWLGGLLALMAASASADTCYLREYTVDHLSANKNQSVHALQVRLPEQRSGIAQVWAKFRDSKEVYQQALFCWAAAPGSPAGAWQCGVECDGGTFTAWQKSDALLLRTRGGFLVTGECGEPGDEDPPRFVTDTNAIETTFKLFPIDLAKCPVEAD